MRGAVAIVAAVAVAACAHGTPLPGPTPGCSFDSADAGVCFCEWTDGAGNLQTAWKDASFCTQDRWGDLHAAPPQEDERWPLWTVLFIPLMWFAQFF